MTDWIERIRRGAAVHCTDGRLGSVESIEGGGSGEPQVLRVRRDPNGQALSIPLDLVDQVAEDGSVLLTCTSHDLERSAGRSAEGPGPTSGRHGFPADTVEAGAVLELREEDLVPHKEPREAGRVRIRKELEEVPRELEVEALREQVAVEHVPVGKVVAEKQAPWREGDVLVVPVYEEQVQLVKQLVLREELRIRLETTTQTRRFADTVERERVVIEDPTNQGFVREQYRTADVENEPPPDVAERTRHGSGLEGGGRTEEGHSKGL